MALNVTKQDLATAKAGYYECCQNDKDIEDCKACGLNVDEQELHNTALKEFFREYLARFSRPSPGPPGT